MRYLGLFNILSGQNMAFNHKKATLFEPRKDTKTIKTYTHITENGGAHPQNPTKRIYRTHYIYK